ncbi:UDP-N-acetylmuramoyl-L-alanyl-D-glutamate--2,6-diaminopimelate ligase [Marinobacterium sp. AK62]|uniref:UDP-N-acetylmuramoyl-L-alanyl-D-glutamate--2,6-diaminopimelate ligase n=1 Tax=Marinobacterium alkalitolerans TaxID=1542925 RepID=A0ABS3Z738_9GAMM|nr:UDP-N-acetylmuramoyl-L-alanyl-D-glutamate--2,6-diaminopimelate ligase [Marinobacterium alkalitolerans]MBP0047526.1 UDP-N-acetylmuramoyl-L-alanyl-D-glutamate--2,6-diaminopimelate ligase [Marinobacterium alkalitolerans]
MSTEPKRLNQLLADIECQEGGLYAEAPLISSLALDSRQVEPGCLFFARQGSRVKGSDFIPDALERGAAAIMVAAGELDSEARQAIKVPVLEVEDLDRCIGQVASRFYDSPSDSLKVIGVTGTNGKTSCACFLVQALEQLGHRAALIGTLGNGFWGELDTATHTTPDPISLQRLMARLRDGGAEYIVMEVSSHALDQQRVSGIQFAAGAFTNLTRDHLDYHGDMNAYGDAKARLFTDYQPPVQLLNLDDVFGRTLWERLEPAPGRVLGFALSEPGADLTLEGLEFNPSGIAFTYKGVTGEARVQAPVMGSFNASNLLLCAGLLEALGFEVASIAAALSGIEPVPGRMQPLPKVEGKPAVVVDFAHTPDALAQALQALRLHSGPKGHLVCVFGCGGDRDTGKRSEMGELAAKLADRVLVTSDNPRSEAPEAIIADILAGVPTGVDVEVEVDRAVAIRRAVATSGPEDVVLLAGKGHEPYQEIQGVRHPFNDFDHAWHVLKEGAEV